ncbi:MAG: hypothetical protein LBG82_05355, partial [Clostridiales Family XIII bacterium]|nr:hypothetical protein [Clostridiales Family XIII bacterium]
MENLRVFSGASSLRSQFSRTRLWHVSRARFLARRGFVALLTAIMVLTAVPVSADTVPAGNGDNNSGVTDAAVTSDGAVAGGQATTGSATTDSNGDSVGRNDDSGNDNSDSATTGSATTDSNGDNADSTTTNPAITDSPAATGSDADNSNGAGVSTDSAAKTKSVSPADTVEQLILRVKTTSNNESYLVPTGGNVTGNQNFDWTINWGDGTTTQHTGARGA